MAGILTANDREAARRELQRVFDPKTADTVLQVMDNVVAQARNGGPTREDFSELKQIVAELAEAQRRTEQRVEELAEAQRHTEKTIRELIESQARTERAVGRLAEQVGGLSETVGGDIEDIAYIVLHEVLQREFGWKVGVLERVWQTWNGQPEEVNVFGLAADPARPDLTIWIVGEAKHNLTLKEVRKFAEQVARARKRLAGEIFPVCFCYRARPEVVEEVKRAGLRLAYSYGKLV